MGIQRDIAKMEPHTKPLLLNAAGLLTWTLLSASINTASILEKGAEWPAYGTFAWLAVLYAILTLGLSFKNTTLTGAAQNACLACLFSGLVVAQLAPGYVGVWKDLGILKQSFHKMDICVIVFSSSGILGGYAMNSHIVGLCHKKWCSADKTAPQAEL